ncbi:hypothetical protein [Tengunoibacter tsumagoiensis]|uniref:Uncharacterized protein n=1 Tax=Tengunoibacter tsumagoiensis TaxID=2014871 RepID=A0A402A6H4_9CHLR|nr:hypothetical protein [Tengunoibacter tsumagoiensis]GCE14591.1 hypothetical protein KTT_44500 [Tengunoibacter tsumagoiensis]
MTSEQTHFIINMFGSNPISERFNELTSQMEYYLSDGSILFLGDETVTYAEPGYPLVQTAVANMLPPELKTSTIRPFIKLPFLS